MQQIANKLGAGWNYQPTFAGVNYQRLEAYKTLQWPVAVDGSDQPMLYTKQFSFPDGKAQLFPLVWREPLERVDDEYDLHLNNGWLLEHSHEGNLTYRSPGIKEKTPETFLEVSPELAEERGVESGSLVQLTSRRGPLQVRAVVTDRVQKRELYMPMNSAENPVNVLTGSHTDPVTHTPAYKETAVKLQVLNKKGENPLPRTNSRFGHPTPQHGVEVERKWKRRTIQCQATAWSTFEPSNAGLKNGSIDCSSRTVESHGLECGTAAKCPRQTRLPLTLLRSAQLSALRSRTPRSRDYPALLGKQRIRMVSGTI